MITMEVLCQRIPGLTAQEIERWIDNQWLNPEGTAGHYMFYEIDEARVKLITELKEDMGIEEEYMTLILSLLDQLYTARRQMHYLRQAVVTDQYPEVKEVLKNLIESD